MIRVIAKNNYESQIPLQTMGNSSLSLMVTTIRSLSTATSAFVVILVCMFVVKARGPPNAVPPRTVILTISLIQLVVQVNEKGLRGIPGPLLSRYTNLPLKWHVVQGKRTPYIHGLHQIYGSIVRIAPHEISVSNIDSYHQIHGASTPFTKSKWYQVGLLPWFLGA